MIHIIKKGREHSPNYCESCLAYINKEDVDSFITFTLGNMKNDEFIAGETRYYHLDCL
ncbi:MAG: hypothetical protein ACFFAS_16250 [Promethearchaeota archaeon]